MTEKPVEHCLKLCWGVCTHMIFYSLFYQGPNSILLIYTLRKSVPKGFRWIVDGSSLFEEVLPRRLSDWETLCCTTYSIVEPLRVSPERQSKKPFRILD